MNIIIFGVGCASEALFKKTFQPDCNILFCCDSNVEKQNKEYKGYKILNPNEILSTSFDCVLISSYNYYKEMASKLIELGINEEQIVYFYNDVKTTYRLADKEFGNDICDGTYIQEIKNIEKLEKIVDLSDLKLKINRFKKEKPIITKPFKGETFKARERRKREGFFDKYCHGDGLDIGYGNDILLPECFGWEYYHGNAEFLNSISDESFDYVHSSHCLEHMVDVRLALQNWFRVIKKGGYLILLLPHRDLYEKKKTLPSKWNGDHKHMFLIGKEEKPDTLDIVNEIKSSLKNYDIKYVKVCNEGHTITDSNLHSDGEYSIEVVIQKVN